MTASNYISPPDSTVYKHIASAVNDDIRLTQAEIDAIHRLSRAHIVGLHRQAAKLSGCSLMSRPTADEIKRMIDADDAAEINEIKNAERMLRQAEQRHMIAARPGHTPTLQAIASAQRALKTAHDAHKNKLDKMSYAAAWARLARAILDHATPAVRAVMHANLMPGTASGALISQDIETMLQAREIELIRDQFVPRDVVESAIAAARLQIDLRQAADGTLEHREAAWARIKAAQHMPREAAVEWTTPTDDWLVTTWDDIRHDPDLLSQSKTDELSLFTAFFRIADDGMTPDERRALDPRSVRRKIMRTIRAGRMHVDAITGVVGKHQPYSSNAATAIYLQDKEREKKWAEDRVLINPHDPDADPIPLSDAIERGVISRGQRTYGIIKAMEERADAAELQGVFLTLTLPPEWHPNPSVGALSYDPSLSPQAAARELQRRWACVRADLHNLNIKYFGVWVIEPHQDSTPHRHPLLWLPADNIEMLEKIVRRYWPGEHAAKFELIDKKKGSATSYVIKYIAKQMPGALIELDTSTSAPTTDGDHLAAANIDRVSAWRRGLAVRTWGFIGLKRGLIAAWQTIAKQRNEPSDELFRAVWLALKGRHGDAADPLSSAAARREARATHRWLSTVGRITAQMQKEPTKGRRDKKKQLAAYAQLVSAAQQQQREDVSTLVAALKKLRTPSHIIGQYLRVEYCLDESARRLHRIATVRLRRSRQYRPRGGEALRLLGAIPWLDELDAEAQRAELPAGGYCSRTEARKTEFGDVVQITVGIVSSCGGYIALKEGLVIEPIFQSSSYADGADEAHSAYTCTYVSKGGAPPAAASKSRPPDRAAAGGGGKAWCETTDFQLAA